jgi:hypothetical protein
MLISFLAATVDKVKLYARVIYEGVIKTASDGTENKFPQSVAIRSTLRRIALSTHSDSTF